ncbi:MAG: hypothetical protein P9L92_04255 [Candidatus Electryonea clarkiae]|nr:hypothetical protein [Candidatus Electryonea clarkiae]MDP8286074.1 hypothetical protein [Candidatus Electryonea clarkiae]
MIEKIKLDLNLLRQLADPSDPALRAKVLADLLEYPEDDPDLIAAKKKIPESPWIKATLNGHNGDGTWGDKFGFYKKYEGTSWVLLHLSELGAPADLPPIRKGVEYLLSTAKSVNELKGIGGRKFSGCSNGVYWRYPIICLAAHMAAVLSRFGHAAHPITRSALASCMHHFDPEEGFICQVIDQSLQPQCFMTVPKVLKAFLAIPENDRTGEDDKMIRDLVKLIKKFNLYVYAARDSREWNELTYKMSSKERLEQKPAWISEGRTEPRREKAGWLRFSFPLSYNSDLLEVLLLLGEAGAEYDEIIENGLSLLLNKRGKDGMWKMTGGLNGKMWADLDIKGKPSPWITYRALLAFKNFGLLDKEGNN